MKKNLTEILSDIVSSPKCLLCKGCCIFYPGEKHLAPCFTAKEFEEINFNYRRFLCSKSRFYQAKLKTFRNSNLSACSFLDEATHQCRIYNNRPLDCSLWPFILGYGKQANKDISLWVISPEMCPAVDLKSKIKPDFVEKIIIFLETADIISEISRGERYIWQNEPYYIHVRSLSDVMERNG